MWYSVFCKKCKREATKRSFIERLSVLEANDKSHLLIIELKAGKIDKNAFGQISEYLVVAEKELKKEVKGLLIGSFFAEHIPDLLKTSKYEIGVKKYTLKIELE